MRIELPRRIDPDLSANLTQFRLGKSLPNRRNALFYKTLNGARVGDIFMSLIHTAELNAAAPFDYLIALLRHPDEVCASPGDWMPWNYPATLPDTPPTQIRPPRRRRHLPLWKRRCQIDRPGEALPCSAIWGQARLPEAHYDSKNQAIRRAREVARSAGGDVVIHNRDGLVQESTTYPPRGASARAKRR
jgi:hypothetical protein